MDFLTIAATALLPMVQEPLTQAATDYFKPAVQQCVGELAQARLEQYSAMKGQLCWQECGTLPDGRAYSEIKCK